MRNHFYFWLAVPVAFVALLFLLVERSTTHRPFLVIGILSARENFKQRNTLRNTWLKNRNSSVKYKFVVGSKHCDLHVSNRRDRYSCKSKEFEKIDESMRDGFPIMTSSVGIAQVEKVFWNATLKVHHSVIVKSLGVSVAVHGSSVKVMIYDDSRDEVIVEANGLHENNNLSLPYIYTGIEPIMLPEGFEGSLCIVGDNLAVDKQTMNNIGMTLPYSAGAVDIEYMDQSGNVHGIAEGMFLASMHLSINDVEAFHKKLSLAGSLNAEHKEKQSLINEKLLEEMNVYQDILLVDVEDVYRNLPDKLLHFHVWVSKISPHFVLKTDDDCYVDVDAVLETLAKIPNQHKIWYGRFRHDWYVERYGKWAEKDFRSSEYPAFACGSCNIVSGDLSSWLASNVEYLHQFQGEDTSMGIWLSAVMPRYLEDERIQCENMCSSDAIVIPELSPEKIVEKWNNRLQCGNPCECV
ncbi:UDP-GalNAc:beta-1,3-N-acetylgalactosaminyltransferase 2-like isoform X1 [Dreissena polymorpha]|uniref:Hexosyltransferase n=1 Tax=Dreissena polymorpha TaxID=45954 RepID=A0A9D4EWP2_DREPO|nr:UDP-GalNAc:beta-1,3-N-acetylgalactosaminyltransferase 2-like isoform X1 [Dreissena polymorpha]KAH3787231.1 hypothetical protein DPMN_165351 [Dreissena polymorpha]